ncbi:UNVERIFIED_ORG: hypothetical protein ABIC43_000227 [Variovorax guangxiensis]
MSMLVLSPVGEAFAARSRRTAGRRAAMEARAAGGLVSVSTTCRGLPSAEAWADNCITIDPAQSRVTRLRKGLGIAAKQLHNMGARNQRIWMQTLTYAGTNANWRPEHISRYLDALRKWHYAATGSKKVRYAWVAELQQRGVIHYHVIVWLDGGLTPPKGDMAWKRKDRAGLVHWEPPMWPHGMTRRDLSTAPVAYLMKYASKVESKNVGSFPHGARIHGAGGMDASGRSIRRWVLWPAYVQGNASVSDRFRPAPGGGYCNAETGELLLAEFAPTGGGFQRFIRVRTTSRRIDAAGPFSWLPERPTVH